VDRRLSQRYIRWFIPNHHTFESHIAFVPNDVQKHCTHPQRYLIINLYAFTKTVMQMINNLGGYCVNVSTDYCKIGVSRVMSLAATKVYSLKADPRLGLVNDCIVDEKECLPLFVMWKGAPCWCVSVSSRAFGTPCSRGLLVNTWVYTAVNQQLNQPTVTLLTIFESPNIVA